MNFWSVMKVLSVSRHTMTTKEFKGLTKISNEFSSWRRASKTVNFGVLFNCGAPTLAKQLENNGYKYNEAMEYLELTNNITFYNQLLKSKMGKMTAEKVAFLAAATLMLEAYYTGFPGVKERSIREAEFAWKNGYARCWHGPIRPLPELRYMKRNKDGNVIGADQKMWSGMVSNLRNDAGNSPIQCMEANIAIKTIINASMYVREWGLKSYLWNMVHDSEDWIVYKPELNLVCSLLNACSTWKRQPHVGVDMCMDFEICDPAKGHQKNMYHGGLENPFKIDPIEVALDKWNKEHPEKPLYWHGCIL